MMQTIRDLWWLLTGQRRASPDDDPRVSWFREQADAANASAERIEVAVMRERQRRSNLVEQAYLRGGRRHGGTR